MKSDGQFHENVAIILRAQRYVYMKKIIAFPKSIRITGQGPANLPQDIGFKRIACVVERAARFNRFADVNAIQRIHLVNDDGNGYRNGVVRLDLRSKNFFEIACHEFGHALFDHFSAQQLARWRVLFVYGLRGNVLNLVKDGFFVDEDGGHPWESVSELFASTTLVMLHYSQQFVRTIDRLPPNSYAAQFLRSLWVEAACIYGKEFQFYSPQAARPVLADLSSGIIARWVREASRSRDWKTWQGAMHAVGAFPELVDETLLHRWRQRLIDQAQAEAMRML